MWLAFVNSSLAVGLITLGAGLAILLAPDILGLLAGGYLIFAGVVAAGHYLGWF